MAEIYDIGSGIRMYNVSYGVGDGMFNKMDDVMLVQWLLKRHFDRSDKKAKLGTRYAIPVINGVWSDLLSDIVKIYQYDAMLNIKNADFPLNGKVYPIGGCGGLNKSVVALLNLSVAGHYKKYYEMPNTDPSVYSDVKAMFDRCGMAKAA